MGWTSYEGLMIEVFERCCKLPRYVGVYPYVTKGTRVEVSKLLVVYDLVLAAILIAFDAYTVIMHRAPSEEINHSVTTFIRSAQLVMTSVTVTLSCFWILRNRMKIQEMLDELMKFEDIIQPKTFKVCDQLVVGILGVLTVLVIVHFIVSPMEDYFMIIVHIRFHLATIMIFSNAAFFTRSVRIIGSAYRAMTDQLSNLRTHHSMKDIQKAMEHLVSASEALNIAFGPQMLALTSTSFVLNTGNMYLAITSNSSTSALVSIIWVITFTKLMLHLIYSCNWTAEKAKELDKAFYRTVLEDKSGELSQQVRMCLHFTNNRKVEFTACGFFTIDFTLAGSMVAAATTYLVILIQIGGSEKSGD